MPLKHLAKKSHILIAHSIADLLHGAVLAFEHSFSGGNAQLLQVVQRTVSRGLLEAADEVAQAHAYATSRSFERKVCLEMFVEPGLRAGDGVVGVLHLEGYDSEARLPCARRLDEQRLGALHGNVVAAVSLDEIKTEVERSVHAAAGVEVLVLCDHQFRHPLH